MPRTNALLIKLLASNVIGLVISHQCAEAVPVLPRIQGNLTGFVVEAEPPKVEDLLLKDKSMKQLKCLKPKLMTNLI